MGTVAKVQDAVQAIDSWDLSLPTRLTPPEVTGIIRRQPEDFIVTEILAFDPVGDGEHVYFDIEKRNANTGWVAWQLSEFLGIREMDVGYAGRKDRHAITRQWFSAYLPGRELPDMNALDVEGVTLHGVTRHRQKLRQGEIRENRFELQVVVPGMDASAADEIQERLSAVRDRGFPNYFGPQRFGKNAANLEGADRLLRRREKVKGDRGMLISAARAFLFNHYLADQLGAGTEVDGAEGPLIGKVRDPQPGEDRLDEKMQAWVAGLRRLGAKADTRPLVVIPASMTWDLRDTVVELSFSLPAGAFATSLLSEVFIVEDACQ